MFQHIILLRFPHSTCHSQKLSWVLVDCLSRGELRRQGSVCTIHYTDPYDSHTLHPTGAQETHVQLDREEAKGGAMEQSEVPDF